MLGYCQNKNMLTFFNRTNHCNAGNAGFECPHVSCFTLKILVWFPTSCQVFPPSLIVSPVCACTRGQCLCSVRDWLFLRVSFPALFLVCHISVSWSVFMILTSEFYLLILLPLPGLTAFCGLDLLLHWRPWALDLVTVCICESTVHRPWWDILSILMARPVIIASFI